MNTLTIDRDFAIRVYRETPSVRTELIKLLPNLFPVISRETAVHLEFGVQGDAQTKQLFIDIANKLGIVYNDAFNCESAYYDIYFSYYWNNEFYGPSYSYTSCTPIDLGEHFGEALQKLLDFIKPLSQC